MLIWVSLCNGRECSTFKFRHILSNLSKLHLKVLDRSICILLIGDRDLHGLIESVLQLKSMVLMKRLILLALLSLITMRWWSIGGTDILLLTKVVVVPPPLIKGIAIRRIAINSLAVLISHAIHFFLGTT